MPVPAHDPKTQAKANASRKRYVAILSHLSSYGVEALKLRVVHMLSDFYSEEWGWREAGRGEMSVLRLYASTYKQTTGAAMRAVLRESEAWQDGYGDALDLTEELPDDLATVFCQGWQIQEKRKRYVVFKEGKRDVKFGDWVGGQKRSIIAAAKKQKATMEELFDRQAALKRERGQLAPKPFLSGLRGASLWSGQGCLDLSFIFSGGNPLVLVESNLQRQKHLRSWFLWVRLKHDAYGLTVADFAGMDVVYGG